MRSCIFVFYIALFAALFAAPGAAALAAQPSPSDPDALYRERADVTKAQAAADIWQQRLAGNPRDFEAAWKLARASYWLGGHAVAADRRTALERGVDSGMRAAMLEPGRPEGHFWSAACMGALAESFGLRQGLRYRGAIKEALDTVLRIDPGFQKGSADRALGRWYFKVPALFGGSKTKSEAHLRQSLTYDPGSIASHVFLAETLLDMQRRAEAGEELRRAIAAPIDPDWEPEDREFKAQAEALLRRSVQ
jgi:thioredoxin-like negative regulator of GroEL